jgi:hypothetical protein
LIRLSHFYEHELVPLLSVLQVGETFKGKLAEDGNLKVRKKEIKGKWRIGCVVRDLV